VKRKEKTQVLLSIPFATGMRVGCRRQTQHGSDHVRSERLVLGSPFAIGQDGPLRTSSIASVFALTKINPTTKKAGSSVSCRNLDDRCGRLPMLVGRDEWRNDGSGGTSLSLRSAFDGSLQATQCGKKPRPEGVARRKIADRG